MKNSHNMYLSYLLFDIALLIFFSQIEAEDLPELSEKYDIAFVPVFVLIKVYYCNFLKI